MKNVLSLLAAGGLMLSASAISTSAANMGEKTVMMLQCSGACNVEYLQCVASAQQLASTPLDGLNQIQTNFADSTQCGQSALACNASCN